MGIATSVCVYYSLDHVFHQTWRGLLTEMRIATSVCVYYSLDHLFHQTWRGLLTEMRIAMSVCVYYSLGFSPSMEGDFQRNENCTVCTCILFPWSRISPNMEGVAHRNENCNVCTCILFPWSPISLTRMCSSQKWELQCMYVYIIPINTNFPKHGVGCSHKWDLQCLYVYIIPLITYFPDMEGFAERNENCNVCVCILLLWSPISPTWRGCSQKWELQCLYVYTIP